MSMNNEANLTTNQAHIDDMDNITRVGKNGVKFDGYTWRATDTYTSQGETWVMIKRKGDFGGMIHLTVNAKRVQGL
jgi:hypothetical protein